MPRGVKLGPRFRDGLGTRVIEIDKTSGDTVEVLHLCPELCAFEKSIKERTSRLSNFRHPRFAPVRAVEAVSSPDSRLGVVSDHIVGPRLSEILEAARTRRFVLDTNAALQLVRELLSAISVLHESRNVTHGAIAPERLIMTPRGRLVIVDYTLGLALERLQWSRTRLWRDFRIAMPPTAGSARFDHRADVVQIGILAVALLVSRPLDTTDYSNRLKSLLEEAREVTVHGDRKPLSAGLRSWLERTLPLDARKPFSTSQQANVALEQVLTKERRLSVAPSALKAFVGRYLAQIGENAAQADESATHKAVFEQPSVSIPESAILVEPLPGDDQPRAAVAPASSPDGLDELDSLLAHDEQGAIGSVLTTEVPVALEDLVLVERRGLQASGEPVTATEEPAAIEVACAEPLVVSPTPPAATDQPAEPVYHDALVELPVDLGREETPIVDVFLEDAPQVEQQATEVACAEPLAVSPTPPAAADQPAEPVYHDALVELPVDLGPEETLIADAVLEKAPQVEQHATEAAAETAEATTIGSWAPIEASAPRSAEDLGVGDLAVEPDRLSALEEESGDAAASRSQLPAEPRSEKEDRAHPGQRGEPAQEIPPEEVWVINASDLAFDSQLVDDLHLASNVNLEELIPERTSALPETEVVPTSERSSPAADTSQVPQAASISEVVALEVSLAAEVVPASERSSPAADTSQVPQAASISEVVALEVSLAAEVVPASERSSPAADTSQVPQAASIGEVVALEVSLAAEVVPASERFSPAADTSQVPQAASIGEVVAPEVSLAAEVVPVSERSSPAADTSQVPQAASIGEVVALEVSLAADAAVPVDDRRPAPSLAPEAGSLDVLPVPEAAATQELPPVLVEPASGTVPFEVSPEVMASPGGEQHAPSVEPACEKVDRPMPAPESTTPAVTGQGIQEAVEVFERLLGSLREARATPAVEAFRRLVSTPPGAAAETPAATHETPAAAHEEAATMHEEVATTQEVVEPPATSAVAAPASGESAEAEFPVAVAEGIAEIAPRQAFSLSEAPCAEPGVDQSAIASAAPEATGAELLSPEEVTFSEVRTHELSAVPTEEAPASAGALELPTTPDTELVVEAARDELQTQDRAAEDHLVPESPTPAAEVEVTEVPLSMAQPEPIDILAWPAEPVAPVEVREVVDTTEPAALLEASGSEPARSEDSRAGSEPEAVQPLAPEPTSVELESVDSASQAPSTEATPLADRSGRHRRRQKRARGTRGSPGATPLVESPRPQPETCFQGDTSEVVPQAVAPPVVEAPDVALPAVAAITAAADAVGLPALSEVPLHSREPESARGRVVIFEPASASSGPPVQARAEESLSAQSPGRVLTFSVREKAVRVARAVPKRLIALGRTPIRWKQTVAAALMLVALGGVRFATAYWFKTPPPTGGLVVESVPDGLDIFINNTLRGKTPMSLTLPAGDHALEVRGKGLARTLPVRIVPGVQAVERLTWPVSVRTGSVLVESEPPGATVSIDGEPRGATPLTLNDLPAGVHTLVVQGSGGRAEQSVTIEPEQTTAVRVAVFSGWMAVFAPFDLQMYEKGRFLGSTEVERIMLPAGRHAIEFVNESLGYRVTRQVTITPGDLTPISIELPSGTLQIEAPPGFEVWLDNERVGQTPLTPLKVPLGTHEVRLKSAQTGERRHVVVVTLREPARVTSEGK